MWWHTVIGGIGITIMIAGIIGAAMARIAMRWLLSARNDHMASVGHIAAGKEISLPPLRLAQQFRQLRQVGRDPPRLVAGEPLRGERSYWGKQLK